MTRLSVARTDNTRFCPKCNLRFSARFSHCPRRGHGDIAERPPSTGERSPLPRWAKVSLVGAYVVFVIAMKRWAGTFEAADAQGDTVWLPVLLAGGLVALVLALRIRVRPRPPNLHTFEPVDGTERHFRGSISAGEGWIGDAEDRLVAVRVAGVVGGARVNDALVVPFELRMEDGRAVKIDPSYGASLALPVEGRETRTLPQPVERLLKERGLPLVPGKWRLSLQGVRDGDEVEVTVRGAPMQLTDDQPYRGAVDVLREDAVTELCIVG